MVDNELLFTIAEIGAAYAGFSTLISAVVFRRIQSLQTTYAISMLILSLIAVSFAILPALPPLYGIDPELGWRLMSLAYAIAWALYLLMVMRSVYVRRYGVGMSELRLLNKFNAYVLHPSCIIVLLLGAAGVWGSYTAPVYVTALLVMLILSAYLFANIVMSLFLEMQSEKHDEENTQL